MHNEEQEDKTIWEMWLHKVYDKSYNDFRQSLGMIEGKAAPTQEETAEVIKQSFDLLQGFQRATPSTRSWWLEGTRVIESIAAKTTDVLPGGTIHYKLTLPLYALSRLEGVVVAPKLTKSGISGEVALGAQTISILGLNVLTLEGASAINLGAAPGTPITLTLDVTNGDGQKLFVQSDTTIQLEISNRTVASGGVQALEAYWIP